VYGQTEAAGATLTGQQGDRVRPGNVGVAAPTVTLTLGDGDALRLVDRKRDFLVTAGGKNVSPAQVENALRASAYVSEVTVFGDTRRYPVALLELDDEIVAEWARARGLAYTGYASLMSHPDVLEGLLTSTRGGFHATADCPYGARRARHPDHEP
jgi:hypothetical protein